ncbi:MAG TPA: plasma-membrane proton-efflux P-type ATPase, partial [Anaerolineaceae bacterium]
LQKYGPNSIPEQKTRPWIIFLRKMWAPVPWMLEASILLELVLGKYVEAGIIGMLVVFNALMSTLQENKAHNALALLRKRLTVTCRVLRDGKWQAIASEKLVPGDVVYLRLGDLVPADILLVDGNLLVDQSTLTGESMPVEAEKDTPVFAGTTVQRGEATGNVISTGMQTKFGETAELVRLAKNTGQLEKIVFSVARNLVILDAGLVIVVLIYALLTGLPLADILPFALILLVASVPVALPATFTLSTALGAVELAKNGVLVTRLSAIEEAASMEVLCADKTGTLTENRLEVAEIKSFPPYSADDVLRLAVMASDEATQDPLDVAILDKARQSHLEANHKDSREQFIPFEPATKRAEAVYREDGHLLRVLKGAPQVISLLDEKPNENLPQAVEELAAKGLRVLAIASGIGNDLHVAGLVALQDPPRSDSKQLIGHLKELGIRVVMITGDGLETAKAVAASVGIGRKACRSESIEGPKQIKDDDCEVYGEVLPEDKFRLVKKYQQAGYIVGMTGDGVNDAPALKQADVGIAVSNATDVAKAAASLVLTSPGLSNVVAAIETSRRIYQRMLTYTLNKIIKTIEIAIFLSFGLILTRTFVTTPLLMVLLLFTNDFVTMTISTDRVKPSSKPNRWKIRSIVLGAVSLALPILALSFAIFLYAQDVLLLPLPQLQTLLFTMLVFSGQGTIYLVRNSDYFWHSAPSLWMIGGTTLDIIFVTLLASQGILMAAIPLVLVLENLGIIVVYLILLDFVKVRVFSKLLLR